MESKIINAKGVMYVMLPILLLQFASLVAAVDIIFYESTSQCGGSGYAFNGIGPNICCVVSANDGGSVLVTSTSGSSQASKVYRGGGCQNQVGSGSGNICTVGGQFTGAFWYNARRRSLLDDSKACNSQMKATGVVYTEHGAQGHWILHTADAAEMYTQMQYIPDSEKPGWLQAQGATYTEF